MRLRVEHQQGQRSATAGRDGLVGRDPASRGGTGQATEIGGIVEALQRLNRRPGASSETEQVIAKALEAGLTPDGIAALLADSNERPGRYTDAAPALRRTPA